MFLSNKTQRGVIVLSADQDLRYYVNWARSLGWKTLIYGDHIRLY